MKENISFFHEALAICPLDGRYANVGQKFSQYFSEYALVKYRMRIEIMWLIKLIDLKLAHLPEKYTAISTWESLDLRDKQDVVKEKLTKFYEKFSEKYFLRIKEIESRTNHDVKAVELFIAEELENMGLSSLKSFVHIGCTSEDINNAAYALMITEALSNVWFPAACDLVEKINSLSKEYAGTAMLAHTHGQAATPTTVGKEFAVFLHRFRKNLEVIKAIKIEAKFNGATGNYSAISMAYPQISWQEEARDFVENYLGLHFNAITTQIENHDYICYLADAIRHFNNVIYDLDIDMWLYISKGYFKQVAMKTEVGSSTMPHKVNPIFFENSEANTEMSNAIFMVLSNKLAHSRMQRDLSDSSAMRNIGIAFGYSLQSIEQTLKGLLRAEVNTEKIKNDLEGKWELLAEPIQTVLRKYDIADAYDKLKELTRGQEITEYEIKDFIEKLEIDDDDKARLMELTPEKYIGKAEKIATEQ